jgi:predicted nucleic acid-binding protein
MQFEDALTVARMERQGMAELISYDRGFDRIAGIRRLEPE